MKIPKLLFKYKSLAEDSTKNYTLDILQNNRLYFSHRSQLNDPMEGCYTPIHLSYAGSSISAMAESELSPLSAERDKYRILSLTETCLSPQMWAYYADSYKGICLGFYSKMFKKHLQKVIYSVGKSNIVHEPDNLSKIIESDFRHKHINWNHEREWRMISDSGEIYFPLQDGTLACIIVGYNIERENLDAILSIVSHNIPIFKIYAGKTSFDLKLLKFDYEIEYDGKPVPFINTEKELEKYLTNNGCN